MIQTDDHPSHIKKLAEVREIVDTELGFTNVQDHTHTTSDQQAFLFVVAKKVVGCAIAVHIDQAHPVLPSPTESPTAGGWTDDTLILHLSYSATLKDL